MATSLNSLLHRWDVYYHLPHDKTWSLQSYKVLMKQLDHVDALLALCFAVPDNVVQNTMLFVMREGITPMWEDTKNRNGGSFSYKVPNDVVAQVWRRLFLALCGETLFSDVRQMRHANGITISPKKRFCIIKIWMDDCSNQDARTVTAIPHLSPEGCLFKQHEAEF